MAATLPGINHLVDQIQTAPLAAPRFGSGGRHQKFLRRDTARRALSLRASPASSSYEPSELVVTARAGTSLGELEAALAEKGQCLPFEPPRFAAGGTLGGMVAAGLSGPSRGRRCAARLRARRHLAEWTRRAHDLWRPGHEERGRVRRLEIDRGLVGGARRHLRGISQSAGHAANSVTLEFEWEEQRCLDELARLRALPLPLHASAWCDGRLRIVSRARARQYAARTPGSAVRRCITTPPALSGRTSAITVTSSRGRRRRSSRGACLWRMSVPPTAARLEFPGRQFIEWGGAQRWWRTSTPPDEVRAAAASVGGHAGWVRGASRRRRVRSLP